MSKDIGKEIIEGIANLAGRDLTDDEKNDALLWYKNVDLAHFYQGFPQEWKLFKEMLMDYVKQFRETWERAMDADPGSVGDLRIMHAQVFGARKVINSFIEDVESSPIKMRDIPDLVKSNAEQIREIQE